MGNKKKNNMYQKETLPKLTLEFYKDIATACCLLGGPIPKQPKVEQSFSKAQNIILTFVSHVYTPFVTFEEENAFYHGSFLLSGKKDNYWELFTFFESIQAMAPCRQHQKYCNCACLMNDIFEFKETLNLLGSPPETNQNTNTEEFQNCILENMVKIILDTSAFVVTTSPRIFVSICISEAHNTAKVLSFLYFVRAVHVIVRDNCFQQMNVSARMVYHFKRISNFFGDIFKYFMDFVVLSYVATECSHGLSNIWRPLVHEKQYHKFERFLLSFENIYGLPY